MENLFEALRVSLFLASNQGECLYFSCPFLFQAIRCFPCMLPSKVLELLDCGEAYREYIFLCLLVAVTVLFFALSIYFFLFFSLSPGCPYASSILNID